MVDVDHQDAVSASLRVDVFELTAVIEAGEGVAA
jgi:hypothetical protein